jgi:hypothetical protein
LNNVFLYARKAGQRQSIYQRKLMLMVVIVMVVMATLLAMSRTACLPQGHFQQFIYFDHCLNSSINMIGNLPLSFFTGYCRPFPAFFSMAEIMLNPMRQQDPQLFRLIHFLSPSEILLFLQKDLSSQKIYMMNCHTNEFCRSLKKGAYPDTRAEHVQSDNIFFEQLNLSLMLNHRTHLTHGTFSLH